MRFLILSFILAIAIAKTHWFDLSARYSFSDYVREHGKTYKTPAERMFRQKVFERNLATILKHNSENHSWKMGVNKFVDRTDAELRSLRGLAGPLLHKEMHSGNLLVKSNTEALNVPLPHHKDWREEGIISTVKDQGQCGSCWTFGSTETIESYWALATGDLPVLSQQFILDCTSNPNDCGGTGGCGGATATLAVGTIIKAGGQPSEWTYSYRSYFGAAFSCSNDTSTVAAPVARVKSHIHLPANTQQPVLTHLATTGPLITNVDASSWSFYEAGVYSGCSSNATIDHVVQLVGYGHDAELNLDYFLVRNSWGAAWGESGYIKLLRTAVPVCGTDNNPHEGNICNGGPGTVAVCGQCGILYSNSYVEVAV